jgi:hypothetical protein
MPDYGLFLHDSAPFVSSVKPYELIDFLIGFDSSWIGWIQGPHISQVSSSFIKWVRWIKWLNWEPAYLTGWHTYLSVLTMVK